MEMHDRMVRTAVLSDMNAIAELERQLFSDPWTEGMLSDCLCQNHYALSVYVDTLQTVRGYLISTHVAGEAELLRIGVDPVCRRQGIGRMLMDRFAQWCEERETPDVFLEVRQSNHPAIALYERFGLEIVGRRKNYYHNPDEDAALMAGRVAK